MATLYIEWPSAVGMEPPPPQTPDCYRIFVKYRGGWKTTIDECGTVASIPDVPNGEYTVHVHGLYDGEVSAAYASGSLIVTGGSAPVDPTYGDAPPAGNSGIAAPDSVMLSEM